MAAERSLRGATAVSLRVRAMESVAIRGGPLIREFPRHGSLKFAISVPRCCHLCLANENTVATLLPCTHRVEQCRPAVINPTTGLNPTL